MNNVLSFWEAAYLAVGAAAAGVSYCLVVLLMPLLQRYAPARPNARSSHKIPTPQGGGAAVVAAFILIAVAASILLPGLNLDVMHLPIIFAAIAALAVVGATDDMHPLEAIPRLLLQAAAVGIVVAALPAELRIVPILPWWLERLLMLVAILWFLNLTNFMDGIDWMTVAEVIPVTAGLTLCGLLDALPHDATLVAAALCGAIIGFAPFNRPVARLFLGDVGSLPIGLLLGWLLVLLAGNGHLTASLLLPLYYLADATITLLRRILNNEKILQAHRSHFYQRAMDGGFSTFQIVGRVFGLNIILVGLATITVMGTSLLLNVTALTVGAILVIALLWNFSCGRHGKSGA